MLQEVFYWVLNMSIITTVLGFLIYLLRYIKVIPKLAIYSLWSIVLIRLLIPIGISSKYSLIGPLLKVATKTQVHTITLYESIKAPQISASNLLQATTKYYPITYKTNLLKNFFQISALIWSIITILAICTLVLMYIIASVENKNSTHLEKNIYVGKMVSTPRVYGILKPKILLPQGVDEHHLKYILAHEWVHIKRHDNIWRLVALFVACIHWFNPFIWFFLKNFFNDCELACDAGSVKNMNKAERKNYALALVTFSSNKNTIFTSAFGSSIVEVRVKNILSYKKLTLFSTLCFLIMFIVIGFILLTNSKS